MTYVTFELEDGVGVVTFDRPPANALNSDLIGQLGAALDEAGAARSLLIRSANPRFFMAGGDINTYAIVTPDELVALVAKYRRTFQRLRDLPSPTIAVVDGHAQGGGAELLLACDFRIVGPNAQIGFPEIQLAGVPAAGGTQWLPGLVGYERALELMLTGRSVLPAEAVEIGLATRAADDALAAGMELARQIAALPPVAVAEIKRCLLATVAVDPVEGTRREDDAIAAIGVTDAHHDAVRAFLERAAARRARAAAS